MRFLRAAKVIEARPETRLKTRRQIISHVFNRSFSLHSGCFLASSDNAIFGYGIMNKIDPKQAAVFIVVLLGIALLINSTQGFTAHGWFWRSSGSTQTEQINAAAQQAQFQARYLIGGFPSKTNNDNIAVVVATEDGRLNFSLTAAMATRFHTEAVHVLHPFFKAEFVSDGRFNEAFRGSSELFNKLCLTNSIDELVLARQNVQYSEDASLNNLVTATMTLDVIAVPVSGQSDSKTWTFTAYGPGFTKEVARGAAEERLIKQIATGTNMPAAQLFKSVQYR